ncbi:MAG: hypothetical protein AB2L24_14930 [Mangrovibacterium sp.]
MKEIVLILSKTQMDNQVCVGGLTLKGRYVRLLDENGNNQPEDTDIEPRQAWEIEFRERKNNIPPSGNTATPGRTGYPIDEGLVPG